MSEQQENFLKNLWMNGWPETKTMSEQQEDFVKQLDYRKCERLYQRGWRQVGGMHRGGLLWHRSEEDGGGHVSEEDKNVPTEVDGIRFPSRREARRYGELKLLLRGGAISDLQLQVKYPLPVNGHLVGHYVADFVYKDESTKRTIVEDVKGVRTSVYVLKSKLMKAIYGITILET